MALSTYAELLTSVAAWLKPNTTISAGETALMADYVRLAEAEFNRTIYHPFMETTDTLTITDGVAVVPSDLLNVIKIQMTQAPYNEITPGQADLLEASASYATARYPTEYKWSGLEFLMNSPMSVSAAIKYRAAIPALVSNSTNWLLSRFPDMYLFKSVLNGDTRLLDDEQMAIINGRMEKAEMQFKDWASLAHLGTIKMRPSAGVA